MQIGAPAVELLIDPVGQLPVVATVRIFFGRTISVEPLNLGPYLRVPRIDGAGWIPRATHAVSFSLAEDVGRSSYLIVVS